MKHCNIFNDNIELGDFMEEYVDYDHPLEEQPVFPLLNYVREDSTFTYVKKFATISDICLDIESDPGRYSYDWFIGDNVQKINGGNTEIWHHNEQTFNNYMFGGQSIQVYMNNENISDWASKIVVTPKSSQTIHSQGYNIDYYVNIPFITGDVSVYWTKPKAFMDEDPNNSPSQNPIPIP